MEHVTKQCYHQSSHTSDCLCTNNSQHWPIPSSFAVAWPPSAVTCAAETAPCAPLLLSPLKPVAPPPLWLQSPDAFGPTRGGEMASGWDLQYNRREVCQFISDIDPILFRWITSKLLFREVLLWLSEPYSTPEKLQEWTMLHSMLWNEGRRGLVRAYTWLPNPVCA